jgi:lipoprotein-anchoring transpeptidase ErfK/SrfK
MFKRKVDMEIVDAYFRPDTKMWEPARSPAVTHEEFIAQYDPEGSRESRRLAEVAAMIGYRTVVAKVAPEAPEPVAPGENEAAVLEALDEVSAADPVVQTPPDAAEEAAVAVEETPAEETPAEDIEDAIDEVVEKSKDILVAAALDGIAQLDTAEAVLEFVDGDSRVTVERAATERLDALEKQESDKE